MWVELRSQYGLETICLNQIVRFKNIHHLTQVWFCNQVSPVEYQDCYDLLQQLKSNQNDLLHVGFMPLSVTTENKNVQA